MIGFVGLRSASRPPTAAHRDLDSPPALQITLRTMNLKNTNTEREEFEAFPLGEFVCTDSRQGQLIYEHLQNNLPVERRAEANEHLSECFYCRELLVMWEITSDALREEMEKRKQESFPNERPAKASQAAH